MLLYHILAFAMHGKIQKHHAKKKKNLKRQLQHEIKNFNYLMDRFLSQIFKILLIIS